MKLKKIIKRMVSVKGIKKYRMLNDALEFLFLNSILSSFPSKHIRIIILRLMGAKIAKGVPIYGGCEFRKPNGLMIGKGSTVGHDCYLDARKGLIIGENVCIATQVMIWTLQHDFNSNDFKAVGDKVEIEDYAWLASRCIILPGVKIGRAAVVAAGAVVTKNVEPYTVVGGIPAKEIGKRAEIQFEYTPGDWWLPFI